MTPQQASLSFAISRSLPKRMSVESVMLYNHLILCCPFPSYSQSFPMSWVFTSGGQSIGASRCTIPAAIHFHLTSIICKKQSRAIYFSSSSLPLLPSEVRNLMGSEMIRTRKKQSTLSPLYINVPRVHL